MPKYAYPPDQVGTYSRDSDIFNDENALNWLRGNEINEAQFFVNETTPQSKKRILAKKLLADLLKRYKHTEHLTHPNPIGISFVDNVINSVGDLYYAVRDLFTGRRPKTSTTIGICILLGAASGALLGTFVLPGLGTAAGSLGGAIVGAFTSIGGTLGLAALGAAVGSWIGTKLSKLFYKKEKRFQLSYPQAKKIKKNLGLGWKDAEIINGYLRNRINATQSRECKKYYSYLRKLIIEHPEEKDLFIATCFFKNELELLNKQKERGDKSTALQKEINAVIYILRCFTKRQIKNDVISEADKLKLSQYCDNQRNLNMKNSTTALTNETFIPLDNSQALIQTPPVKPKRTRVLEPSFTQSKTSFEKFTTYISKNENKAKHHVQSIERNSNADAIVTFKSPVTPYTPQIYAHTQGKDSMLFSTVQGLNRADYQFLAQQMAAFAFEIVEKGEKGVTIDLSHASSENQTVLLDAFEDELRNRQNGPHPFPPDQIPVIITEKSKMKEKIRAG